MQGCACVVFFLLLGEAFADDYFELFSFFSCPALLVWLQKCGLCYWQCKKIKKSGCTLLLIQKSILRDAVNDLSLHFLQKLGIAVIRDIERDDVEYICKSLGCRPIAHVDAFEPEKLGSALLAEESSISGKGRVVKITGVANPGKTCSILIRGSNKMVLEEADRSLHDALCVVRSLVKKKFMICGGGVAEAAVSHRLSTWSNTLTGMEAYCVKAYAEALEVIPYTLAENAGLHPIQIVTELRKQHALGNNHCGINVKKGKIADMREANVWQPLLVSISVSANSAGSAAKLWRWVVVLVFLFLVLTFVFLFFLQAMKLATETVQMLLKIDDMIGVR